MKKLLPVALSIASVALLGQSSIANGMPPTPIPCYFFKGEKLVIQNTCIYESARWAGGMSANLTWEDRVSTGISYGISPVRGEGKVCPRNSEYLKIDSVCGPRYHRYLKNLKRISKADNDRLFRDDSLRVVQCTQLKDTSVCWRVAGFN